MGFYETRILPHILDKACSIRSVTELRRQLVPQCHGTVLEVGIGSGLNLPFYDPGRVDKLYGLEPSEAMRRKARRPIARAPLPVDWLGLPGEAIPLEDESVDTLLLTFTLCTIPDWRKALEQMHRVLRPDGQLLFLEHGRCPSPGVRSWQDRLTPVWKKLAGGCHLNRPIDELLAGSGFHIDKLDNFYLPKAPRLAGYLYMGRATKTAP